MMDRGMSETGRDSFQNKKFEKFVHLRDSIGQASMIERTI